jgi:RNA polymerase sigma factor (sigma-70 family)
LPESLEVVSQPTPGALGLTRDYRRRPAVETEIRALPAAGATLVAALRTAVAPETLVHGIRRLRTAGEAAAADTVMSLLIERISGLVAAVAYSQAVLPEDREDIVQATFIQVWNEITDTRPQFEFWEVHFNHMVRLACADAAERLRQARRHERPFRTATNDDGDTWSEESTLADPEAIEGSALVAEALAQLDGPVRRAFYLKMQGFKEKSKDTSEPTISTILGVSDRSVRNYLRAAELTLQSWWNRGLLESGQVQA